ncbi:MAG: hypothetical protein JWM21_2322 [Acidobacteria bacterium]|nr:hypothetical protein [Acidobacteriota bacterium]
MRPTRLHLLFSLSLLLTVLSFPTSARADDDTEGDDYDVKARVVRISLIHGDVSYKRHETKDWETARLNTPLVEGDTLATGNNARVEIQIDARNFLRLSSDSVLRIITLRDEGIALSLAEGTATLRLARFDRDKEYFEIDAPKTTIAAESKGVYRLTAGRKGDIQLTVRDGGRARIYSDTAGFTLKDGRTATLRYEGDEAGDWQTASAATMDSWDEWVNERERYLATNFKYDQNMRYYDSDIWGAEDLDTYGSWAYANDYGWIWRPNITIVNNYNDWAPYRYGRWDWCAPYGWTWIGDEPWGWAPYHYGRWVYYDNYWAWCPHSYYRSHRSWWRPALVAFISIDFNFGSNYCWYPLSYRHRDPRSTYFHHDRQRLRPLRGDELASLRRINPAYLRALTTVPARDFGKGRGQPANGDLARRVIDAQPLRGDLPVRPAGTNRSDSRIARPASAVALRPTGATTRTPGVSLDNDLRRSRIFNGRDPVLSPTVNTLRTPEIRPTGAVTRPARSADPPRRNPDGSTGGPPSVDHPVRPRQRDDRPVDRGAEDHNPPAREEGERPGASGRSGIPIRPARPVDPGVEDHNPPAREERERPVRSEPPPRPERDRPSREDSPARPARDESPARPSSSPRSESPRSEPPQRHEPPPRSEPPQRSEPQRHEPPPQRSEPAPQRHESPAPRSEPARPSKPSEDRPTRLERKSSGR